ncbi:serine/threonine-protein kinase ATG1 [Lingula anatina]|uniref:Serine/threonine-protein kinase ATG1 n=1 Tax=Lingula anatina TaxID=7574 RepID=A0A1S3K1F1_LINAN|nr:serine/threonine-protein kinase ATG1 [Lingula anatina]|eukprot:XP_013416219.1 serine/threonine-protein kinase ATG1 [Lingula anatina]
MAAASDPECSVQLGKYVYINMFTKLGQGAFGVVYRGIDTKRNIDVAAKQLEIKDDKGGADAMSEIKTLQKLPRHANLVALYDFHFFRSSFWVVMEFCNCGELKKYFDDHKPVDQATMMDFMRQTAAAVAFMHSLPEPVIHRDLKPGNIMLKQTSSDPQPVIKVTDFGLSKVADVDLSKTFLMTTVAGTPCFMAPEQFAKEPYTAAVDVFALGLIYLGMIYYEEIGDILPFTKETHSSGMLLPPGMLILQSSKTGMPAPDLVQHKTADNTALTQLKELIGQMIKVRAKERPKSALVHEKLRTMCGFSADVSTPSTPPGGDTTDVKTTPGGATSSSSSDSTNTTTSEESGEDLGYQLLQQAVQQMMEEKLEERKEKEKESEDLLKQIRRGAPLLELLMRQGLDESSEEKEGETKFKNGDRVRVTTDYVKAKELQENYGGWNEFMRPYLGKEGKVERKILHVVKVGFPDGQIWSFNPELLTKLTEDGSAVGGTSPSEAAKETKRDKNTSHDEIVRGLFKRFDVVQIAEEAEVVKLLQKGHGGWNEKMTLCLGIKGLINRVDKDGDVFVECINGDDWTFNPEILIKVEDDPNAEIEAGDFVLIKNVAKSEAQELQRNHGEWANGMERSLGHTGIVKAVLKGDRVRVEVARHVWIFNKKLVKLVAKSEEMLLAILKRKFGM